MCSPCVRICNCSCKVPTESLCDSIIISLPKWHHMKSQHRNIASLNTKPELQQLPNELVDRIRLIVDILSVGLSPDYWSHRINIAQRKSGLDAGRNPKFSVWVSFVWGHLVRPGLIILNARTHFIPHGSRVPQNYILGSNLRFIRERATQQTMFFRLKCN